MEAIEALLTRRSVRAYQPRPVEPEMLDTLLECAVKAPSASNQQNWHFTLITDDALLREFEAEFAAQAPALGDDWKARVETGYRVLHGAPAAILISAPSTRDVNVGIAAENICIAAHALGLGSCMIGLVRVVFGGSNGAAWARRLACPEGMEPALMVVVGHPAPGGVRERALKSELITRI